MGFFSAIGSMISTVSSWAKEVAKPIANTVKKVGTWMRDIGEVTEAHLEGKNIVFDEPAKQQPTSSFDYGRPDFSEAYQQESKTLLVKIEESKNEIAKIGHQSDARYSKLNLQIEVVELIIASQTFNRFAANIQLHESNLRIHHQTIQNSVGMLDDINRQRVAVKALMSQVNRIIVSLNKANLNTSNCEKIANIDVDMKPGAVSIVKAYESFEETRSLLEKEAREYTLLVEQQINRALQIRAFANTVPDKKHQIHEWLDRKVIPQLRKSRLSTDDLLLSLKNIPAIKIDRKTFERDFRSE